MNGAQKGKSRFLENDKVGSLGCYTCGYTTHNARKCDTSMHLVDLYIHQLAKGKRPMGTRVNLTSLAITMISQWLKVPRCSSEHGQLGSCSAKGKSTFEYRWHVSGLQFYWHIWRPDSVSFVMHCNDVYRHITCCKMNYVHQHNMIAMSSDMMLVVCPLTYIVYGVCIMSIWVQSYVEVGFFLFRNLTK